MRVFAVVTGVCRQSLDRNRSYGVVQGGAEVLNVRPRTAAGNDREGEVRPGVALDSRFGKPGAGPDLPVFSVFGTSPHVVAAGKVHIVFGPA